MINSHPMKELVKLQKRNIPVGITSVCSANRMVLEAVMKRGLSLNTDVLIEATANQVNQFGGYTGMTPKDFSNYVYDIAESVGFPKNKIILGGDHLGPLTWCNLPENEAMENAEVLMMDFIKAGFTKIHIDTSMKLASDATDKALDTEVIADRGARLASICKKTFEEYKLINSEALEPVYVIGSEVPIPGGAQEEEEGIQVTTVTDFKETVEVFMKAFKFYDIEDLWDNVIGVVVQPGVEFGDDSIHEYNRDEAIELTKSIVEFPSLVFEGHSTDYQTPKKLKEMVEDGIAILKVGPAVTFALREGLFALAKIEDELISDDKKSNFVNVVENVMLENPKNWMKHYHGSEVELKLARKYSFSDRSRYYIGSDKVENAIEMMFDNLRNKEISLSLLSQYTPIQYQKIRNGMLKKDPYDIAIDSVISVLDDYYYAVFPDTLHTIKNHLG